MRDTVYRDEVIEICKRWRKKAIKEQNGEGWYMADILLKFMQRMPSADRPQGEWIDAEIPLESGGSMPIQVCNLCKTFYPLAYTGGGHRSCPHCGAKMKGADDE